MGTLTHAQLITEATELAGNTGLATRCQTWLGLVLRDLYEKFPIPVQPAGGVVTDVPITPQTIAAGVQSLQLSSNNTVRSVRRVWISSATGVDFTELPVEHASTMGAPPRAYTGVSNVSAGRPQRCLAHYETADKVTLYFSPIPDATYNVWALTEGWLTAEGTYSASRVPLYPNDRTVVEGLYAYCLRHQQDEREAGAFSNFDALARQDRVRYANMSGANTRWKLAPGRFSARSTNNPWDWMGPR